MSEQQDDSTASTSSGRHTRSTGTPPLEVPHVIPRRRRHRRPDPSATLISRLATGPDPFDSDDDDIFCLIY